DVADCGTDIDSAQHFAAQPRNSITSENSRNETARQPFSGFGEVPMTSMTSQATEGACAFAWRNYLLLHTGISENDNRRSALHRYVRRVSSVNQLPQNELISS